MQQHPLTTLLLTAGFLAGACAVSFAQTATQPANQAAVKPQPRTVSTTHARRHHRARRTVASSPSNGIITVPLENAPPTPVTQASREDAARQKSADAKLLAQQQAQSQQAAQVTNATVQKAVQQQQAVQRETRIQDAPGPVQTGLVPTSGAPVQPANEPRIQDAPGPVQTVPQQAPAQPQPAPPATPPQF